MHSILVCFVTLLADFESVQQIWRSLFKVELDCIPEKYSIHRNDGSSVKFDTNAVVLTDEKGEPIGTRIFGPVTRELRLKGQTKIISLPPEVL